RVTSSTCARTSTRASGSPSPSDSTSATSSCRSSLTATVMDGAALARKVRAGVAAAAAEWGHVGLTTVLVGEDPASQVYIGLKHKAATEAGFVAVDHRLPASTTQADLLRLVDELNRD